VAGMLVIKESQITVSTDNPQKALNYAVGEIHMDDSRDKIRVFIRSDLNFDRIVGVLSELYKIKDKYFAFPEVPFNTKCHKKSKSFIFEKDIKAALELLVSMSAMSQITFKDAVSKLENKNTIIIKNRPQV
jgi:hypothetical protein